MSRKRRRWLAGLTLAGLLALFAGGRLLGGFFGSGSVDVATVKLERDSFAITVEAPGALQAVHTTPLNAPSVPGLWQYTVRSLAPEGRRVEEGAQVAVLDAQQLQRERIERSAEVRTLARQIEKKEQEHAILMMETEAELEEARVALERARLKVTDRQEVVSRLELAKARIDLEQAERERQIIQEKVEASRASSEAELELIRRKHQRARGRLEDLEQGIEAMTIRAPEAGLVLHGADWNGNKVKVGQSIWRGWKVAEIPDLSEMEAVLEVDEADARHVSPGQEVDVVLEALPNRVFKGHVDSVAPLARRKRFNQPDKIFETVVRLESTDPELMKPGMRVTGRVVTDRVPGALAIPESAVAEEGGRVRVYVAGGGSREIRLGPRSQGRVVVQEGLEEGDEIYVRPPERGP